MMDIRQAIKIVLEFVESEEEVDVKHTPDQEEAIALLKRYTSGWVPKEKAPEWLGKSPLVGVAKE